LGADEQQLGDHELDGVDFGLGQCLAGGEVLAAQRLTDTVSEPLWVAAVDGAGEGDQFLAGGGGQRGRGRPALQHAQEGGGAHVRPGDLDRGGEDGQQVSSQPIQQAAFILAGAFVVAAQQAQLSSELAVGDEGSQRLEAIQGQQAGDAGVLDVVLLLRRPASAGDQVRVDRHHHEPGLNQAFHQQPVAGLQHDPDLVWVGLQGPELFQQGFQGWLAVFHPEHLDHPVAGTAEGNHVEGLGPIDPNA
jgi:hypothetical protein